MSSNVCPNCGATLQENEHGASDAAAQPTKGAFAVCPECGMLLQFGNEQFEMAEQNDLEGLEPTLRAAVENIVSPAEAASPQDHGSTAAAPHPPEGQRGFTIDKYLGRAIRQRHFVTVDLTDYDDLYRFLSSEAVKKDISVSRLVRQMLLHCAKDLGFQKEAK